MMLYINYSSIKLRKDKNSFMAQNRAVLQIKEFQFTQLRDVRMMNQPNIEFEDGDHNNGNYNPTPLSSARNSVHSAFTNSLSTLPQVCALKIR